MIAGNCTQCGKAEWHALRVHLRQWLLSAEKIPWQWLPEISLVKLKDPQLFHRIGHVFAVVGSCIQCNGRSNRKFVVPVGNRNKQESGVNAITAWENPVPFTYWVVLIVLCLYIILMNYSFFIWGIVFLCVWVCACIVCVCLGVCMCVCSSNNWRMRQQKVWFEVWYICFVSFVYIFH